MKKKKKKKKKKIGRKTFEKEEMINNLENVYKSSEKVFSFFRDYAKMVLYSA